MKNDSIIEQKSKKFAIRIMKLVQYLDKNRCPYFMLSQIGRAGTSIGANIVEAEHAISKKEFLQKMYIAYKECNETLYWLDLLFECEYISKIGYERLYRECRELEKILSSITKTTASSIKS